MELRHVHYFVTVCEEGSVSRAAAVLHTTQPNLSRQLRLLESELGVDLFDRRSGRLTPNSTGHALLPAAQELLAKSRALAVAAAVHSRGRLEKMTIAAPSVTLNDVVAPFVATLAGDDPTTDVWSSDDVDAQALFARGADLVITTAEPPSAYAREAIARLPVWLQVPEQHRWAARTVIGVEEAVTETVLLPPTSTSARRSWEAALAHLGLATAGAVEAASGTVAQALSAAGRGVAIATDDPRFGLVPLELTYANPARRLDIGLTATWDPRHPAFDTLRALAVRLRDFTRSRYPRG